MKKNDSKMHFDTFNCLDVKGKDLSVSINDLRSKMSLAINNYSVSFSEQNKAFARYYNCPEVPRLETEYFAKRSETERLANEIFSIWSDLIKLEEIKDKENLKCYTQLKTKLEEKNA